MELVGDPHRADGLTAVFDDEPLGEILQAISVALNLRYEQKQHEITFYTDFTDQPQPH